MAASFKPMLPPPPPKYIRTKSTKNTHSEPTKPTKTIPIKHAYASKSSKSSIRPNYSVDHFMEMINKDIRSDIFSDGDIRKYIRYLLNDANKYETFSKLFPHHTCPGVLIRMNRSDAKFPVVFPSENDLIECIQSKEHEGGSIALNFAYERHANTIWIDTVNRTINRYDPIKSSQLDSQNRMDDSIREYFNIHLPAYIYLGNTLDESQCSHHALKHQYSCQDYVLLYTINRINGMSHEQAATDLILRSDQISDDLTNLYRNLVEYLRSEYNTTA